MDKKNVIDNWEDPLATEKADYEDLVSIAKGVVEDLQYVHSGYFQLKGVKLDPNMLSQVAILNAISDDLRNALDLNSQVQYHIQKLKSDLDGFREVLKKPGSVDLTPEDDNRWD
jgi:hypothetical protein